MATTKTTGYGDGVLMGIICTVAAIVITVVCYTIGDGLINIIAQRTADRVPRITYTNCTDSGFVIHNNRLEPF
jgi:hypothetical protein